MTDLNTYLKSGDYLPLPLRDFHDAKEVFKTMHTTVAVDKHDYAKHITWVAGQCYVIDIFLWFMAKRGWTLQRSRAKCVFADLQADIDTGQARKAEAFKAYMAERSKTT